MTLALMNVHLLLHTLKDYTSISLTGTKGVEPLSVVLETTMLPLHQEPIRCVQELNLSSLSGNFRLAI